MMPAEVDLLPAEVEDLALSHPGVEGDGQNRFEGGLAGVAQPPEDLLCDHGRSHVRLAEQLRFRNRIDRDGTAFQRVIQDALEQLHFEVQG